MKGRTKRTVVVCIFRALAKRFGLVVQETCQSSNGLNRSVGISRIDTGVHLHGVHKDTQATQCRFASMILARAVGMSTGFKLVQVSKVVLIKIGNLIKQ